MAELDGMPGRQQRLLVRELDLDARPRSHSYRTGVEMAIRSPCATTRRTELAECLGPVSASTSRDVPRWITGMPKLGELTSIDGAPHGSSGARLEPPRPPGRPPPHVPGHHR